MINFSTSILICVILGIFLIAVLFIAIKLACAVYGMANAIGRFKAEKGFTTNFKRSKALKLIIQILLKSFRNLTKGEWV